MAKSKSIRMRGKTPLSRQFQNLEQGDSVSVIREIAVASSFPERLQGRTGTVAEKRGRAFVVDINDNGKEKKFIIEPIHLKKINTTQEKRK